MSMSKENLSSPAAGSKARRGKDDVGVSDAMKRQKEVFQEKLRRVSAAQKPNSGKSKTLRNKNLSGPAKKPEPICKGKSYRSKDDRKLKESPCKVVILRQWLWVIEPSRYIRSI